MSKSPATFRKRLRDARALLLDGATGTELNRRGVDTSLPLWSAAALTGSPDLLREVHSDYVAAGAELLTANTFRTHARSFRAAGCDADAADLTRLAVAIAREAAGDAAWVAGSQAPLEDCYTPADVPADADLVREHAAMSENLAAAGVDAILVETHNTIREAVAAARAATASGLPVLVSFVCGPDGRLLSGETVTAAAAAVLPLNPDAVLINCAPTPTLLVPLEELARQCGETPFGGYGNIGRPDPAQGWINTDAEDPQHYADYASAWLAAGTRLLGGCCGTTPEHIRQLRRLLERS